MTYEKNGSAQRIDCDYIAGCDGFHGVSRSSIPAAVLKTYEKSYPFGWLGIMSETPPFPDMVYCYHHRGFALASMRKPMLSRYYIQCELDTKLGGLAGRSLLARIQGALPGRHGRADRHRAGNRKIHRAVAQFCRRADVLRQIVLAGDAAHIVPPTGAKGLNLAVSDVFYLSRGLIEAYRTGRNALSRPLFRHGAAPGVELGAGVVVAHHAAASLSRRDGVRGTDAAQSVRLSARLGACPGVARGAVCRLAVRGLTSGLAPRSFRTGIVVNSTARDGNREAAARLLQRGKAYGTRSTKRELELRS